MGFGDLLERWFMGGKAQRTLGSVPLSRYGGTMQLRLEVLERGEAERTNRLRLEYFGRQGLRWQRIGYVLTREEAVALRRLLDQSIELTG